MEKRLTDLLIKLTFGKLEPFKPEVRAVIEQLVLASVLWGAIFGVFISFLIALFTLIL